jgi:hypothetical protein
MIDIDNSPLLACCGCGQEAAGAGLEQIHHLQQRQDVEPGSVRQKLTPNYNIIKLPLIVAAG